MNEQEIGMNFQSVHPIDTLLVSQLENILNGEKALRARYSLLDASANDTETRLVFSKELSVLRDRADRLYRLVSAMDSFGSADSELSGALA